MTSDPARDLQLVSLVATYDPKTAPNISLGPQDIESIEDALGLQLQVGQALSERGPGSALGIQRHQINLSVLGDRLETRSLQPGFSQETSHLIVDLFESVTSRIAPMPWSKIGYNYVLSVQTEGAAIEVLQRSLLKTGLGDKIGHPVRGGAAWLWLEVGESTLWMKLEPRRSSPTTSIVSVNANFEPPSISGSVLPGKETFVNELSGNWNHLEAILKRLDL